MASTAHFLALSAVMFSAFAFAAPADPTITAPAILPRQNIDQFVGWVQSGGKWYSENCDPGLTWYQNGKYGQCCPTTLKSCYAPTACAAGSLVYPLPDLFTTRTIACTENFGNASYSICNTAFIFENMQDSNPKTDIVCGDSAVNWSYYRKVPASITEAATNAPFSVPQPNAPTNKKSGTSKAWIAGAVIGPLLGLALIGAIIFFVLRRRKNKKNIAPQQGGTAMMAVNTAQAPPGVGGYTDAKPQFTQQQQPTYTAPQQQQPTYIAPQQQPAYNDPYANQGAYAAQQGYNDAPLSPAPQYNTGAGPYNPPVSPPPQDVKHGYVGAPMGGAAELGGPSGGISPVPQAGPAHQAGPVPHAGPSYQAAELGGEARQGAGPSELASNSNSRPTA